MIDGWANAAAARAAKAKAVAANLTKGTGILARRIRGRQDIAVPSAKETLASVALSFFPFAADMWEFHMLYRCILPPNRA